MLSHHERVDGKGYPRNLKLDDIPPQARILTIAEAYDVMLHGDLHKKPIGKKGCGEGAARAFRNTI